MSNYSYKQTLCAVFRFMLPAAAGRAIKEFQDHMERRLKFAISNNIMRRDI